MTNSKVAKRFISALNLNSTAVKELKTAIFFHDIGKMGVDKDILEKKARLTDSEYQKVKDHSYLGSQIAKELGLSFNIVKSIHQHHERCDGSGYPDGLQGDEICFYSRVIMLLDTFDVMHRGRSYQGAKCKEDIICEIQTHAGIKYDQALSELFVRIIEETL